MKDTDLGILSTSK